MKSKFWATIIAIMIVVLTILVIWCLYGRPTLEPGESFSFAIAIIALYNTTKQDLLRKEE